VSPRPAAESGDAVTRALRAAGRATEASWRTADLDALERRVMAAALGRRVAHLPGWWPAAAAVAAAAVTFALARGTAPWSDPVAARVPGPLGAADRAALGLDAGAPVRRVVLSEFESWRELAAVRFGGDAQAGLAPDGFTGRMSLETPAGDGTIEVAVPAAHRGSVAGASVRHRSADAGASVEAVAGLEDGREVDLARSGSGPDARGWRRSLFAVPPGALREGGGVRWIRLRVAGRAPVKLDTMELWTTATEARR
jgi:hypothetical protein